MYIKTFSFVCYVLGGGSGMMNGMSNSMAAMNAKMAAGFNPAAYGRYTSPAGPYGTTYSTTGSYGPSSSSYGDAVQTDTPPQTPPNLKLGGHHVHHHQGYHPYISPQHRMNPASSSTSVAPPLSLPADQNSSSSSSEMLSPGRQQHQQQQQQQMPLMAAPSTHPAADPASGSATAFRPVYRT